MANRIAIAVGCLRHNAASINGYVLVIFEYSMLKKRR